ncbi:MAG: AAA family ATPase [Pseudomonadota bacterium]|nr:AAA family ATPase [Pseudomonadota bacterium]
MSSERQVEKPDRGLVWNEGSERFYLKTQALGPRLDLIKHLIEDSRLLLYVIGERDSGKSALLDEILAMARDGWRVARIQANAMLDPLALLRDLTQALNPGVRGQDRDALLAALEDLLAASTDTRFVPVVLVDDAHELSEEALKLLFSLAIPPRGGSPAASREAHRFRIVLFCEPEIDTVLKAQGLAAVSPPVAHVVDLPPFTVEDTRAYLAERLSRVGLAALLPLDTGVADRIHQDARGLPGAIDAVARETLWRGQGQPSPARDPVPAPDVGRGSPWAAVRKHGWRLYTAAAVLAVATGFIAYEIVNPTDEVRPEPASGVVPLEVPPPKTTRPSAPVPSGPAAEDGRAGTPQPKPADRSPVAVPGPNQPPAATPRAVERVPERAVETPPSEAVDPASVKPQAAPATPPEQQTKRGDQAGRVAAAGSSWLRAQPADAYVLQLIGSANRDTVSGFMGRHAFGAKAAWVTTQRNGQDWHIVVYGPFPDRGAAHAAIGSLPPEVRALRPWARRISDITRALADKR